MGSRTQVYDEIGHGYARVRRADPRWADAVLEAVGSFSSLVNVGAGAGSYEPTVGDVVAVEPSLTMIGQRPDGAAPVVRAVAERLPFATGAFDVALAVLTVHHWSDWWIGLSELRRVSHRQVVVTFDAEVSAEVWLQADYFPETAEMDIRRTPSPSELAEALGGGRVSVLPVPHDMQDAVMLAHWARPEAYLDPSIRAASSGLAQLPEHVVRRGASRLRADLEDGSWDGKYGHLRGQAECDGGYRIVTAP